MKFSCRLVLIFLTMSLLMELVWAKQTAKPKKITALERGEAIAAIVQQAKNLMGQGSRKQALEQLDRAIFIAQTKPMTKNDQRELVGKRALFAEQFLTSASFQSFQEARSLADVERWDECVRELDLIGEKDKDNVLVLRLRAESQLALKQFAAADATFRILLTLQPDDLATIYGLVEIALNQKQTAQGIALLETARPKVSFDVEHFVILKARLLEQAGRVLEAVELLREDQESRLDHVGVLYELGMLYTRLVGHDWPARKMLSLFVTRCKRIKDSELKTRRLDLLLPQAQATLAALDKKLGV